MNKERKYQDHEIRQILDLAIDQDDVAPQSLQAVDGLTLHELQDVGRQVGVLPERITQAVAVFEGRGAPVPRGTTLGLPSSVGRVVPLPRNPSEREWELLIAELRTTFGGKGVVTSQGGLREWSHGNVHAFIEPTETGHRLRLTDANGAVVGIVGGGFFLSFGFLIFMALLSKGDPGFKLAFPAFFGLIGTALVTISAISLPKWARSQEKHMENISRYAVSLLASGTKDDAAEP